MPPEVDVEETDVVKPLTEREGIIPLSTLVTVENHTNTTLILKYDNTEWRVPANDRAAIPYFCAVLWFGDPRAHDDPRDKRIRHRTRELNRLSVKWGFYDKDAWGTIPDVTIKDAAGNELIFPAQDPTGELADPGARDRKQAAQQQALFMEELDRIREENAEMRADLARIRDQQRAQIEARAPERTDTPAVEPDDHDLDLGTIPNVPNVGDSDPLDGGPRDAAPDDLDDVLNDDDDSLPIDDDTPAELADMLDPIEDGDEGPGEGDGIEDADDVVDDDEDDEDDDGDDKGGES